MKSKIINVYGKDILLVDQGGENMAIREFLAWYGVYGNSLTVGGMRTRFIERGLSGCWPAWVDSDKEPVKTHLNKTKAQAWLRYLLALEGLVTSPKDSLCGTCNYPETAPGSIHCPQPHRSLGPTRVHAEPMPNSSFEASMEELHKKMVEGFGLSMALFENPGQVPEPYAMTPRVIDVIEISKQIELHRKFFDAFLTGKMAQIQEEYYKLYPEDRPTGDDDGQSNKG